MTVTVSPITGKLTADAGTIEALKRLCSEDAGRLTARRGRPRVAAIPRPALEARSADDRDIEETLARLMGESAAAARQAFQLAREAAVPGGSVETYGVFAGQAARLTRAFAELVEALARHRSGGARVVIGHLVSSPQSFARYSTIIPVGMALEVYGTQRQSMHWPRRGHMTPANL
jgi:hypothetical protein